MNLVATRWWSMLLMPSTLAMAGALVGVLLLLHAWRRGRRPSQARVALAIALGSIAALYAMSTPLAARWAAGTLEGRFPAIAPEDAGPADAIVVLGGGAGATKRDDGSIYLYNWHAADRFESGLAAFRAGRAPIIVFGGGSTGIPGAPSEGEWNRGRAIERGVPADRALCAPAALYTSDEGEAVAGILRERGAKRVILCSTATHLPRAVGHYRALGFEVLPLPSDFATRGTAEEWSFKLLVPRSVALARFDMCAKEWMGLATEAIRGGEAR